MKQAGLGAFLLAALVLTSCGHECVAGTLGCVCSDSDACGPALACSSDGLCVANETAGGPVVELLATNVLVLRPFGIVTFTANVLHPDDDAVTGGWLTTLDDRSYRRFERTSVSSFMVTLSWADIHAIEAIEFRNDTLRMFKAQFFDAFGRIGSRTITLGLTCDGLSACNGTCVDLSSDYANCGMCRFGCSTSCVAGHCS